MIKDKNLAQKKKKVSSEMRWIKFAVKNSCAFCCRGFWRLHAWKLLVEKQKKRHRWDYQVRLWFCIYRCINYIWHVGAHVWHVGVVICPDVADLKSHLRRGWAQKVLHEPEGMCQNKRAAKSLKTRRSLSGLVCKNTSLDFYDTCLHYAESSEGYRHNRLTHNTQIHKGNDCGWNVVCSQED